MKKRLVIFGLIGLVIIGGFYAKRKYYDPKHRLENARREVNKLIDKEEVQNGDLIFQTSLSRQSKAIQLATKSKYSHCGLIYKNGNDYFVFEAVQPVKLTLFEKDANNITAGQVVHFSINNDKHEHKATIYQVGKSINADKTYKVYATVQEPCNNVLPGMYVLAHIEKNDKQVTSVPSDAVVSFDNKNYIFAFEKEKEEGGKPFTEYRFIEITKGDSNDGFTEIQLPEGFNIQNTKIVTKGAYKLLAAKKNAGEMTCG